MMTFPKINKQEVKGEIEPAYTVQFGGRKKTIALTVSPDGAVTVFAPTFVTRGFIHRFVERKADWILKRRRHLKHAQQVRRPLALLTGEALSYFGTSLRLVNHKELAPVPLVYRRGNRLHVTVSHSTVNRSATVGKLLMAWFTEETARALPHPLRLYQKRLGVSPARVSVASNAKRWGSCSRQGLLRFNWKLSMTPRAVFHYVVVHELCHLKELNHSRRFWSHVGSLLPDYKEHRRWLKLNGSELWNIEDR